MHTYTRRRPEGQLIEGVKNLCRLCLERSENMTPIFVDNSNEICATLSLRIMICVGLEVTREECLPNIICANCDKELDRYYKFRKKCEVSYQRLKLHLQAVKEKENVCKAVEENVKKQEKIMKDKVNCIENVCDDNKFTNKDHNGLINADVNGDISIAVQENCNLNTAVANHIESKEIEAQIEDADNPEISSFLSTVLIQLGILEQQDSTLSILDRGINNLELVMGDDELVTLELVEEDDDSAEEKQNASNYDRIKPIVLNSTAGDSNRSNDTASDNVEEQVMTIKWKPEPVFEGGVGGVGDSGGAWCGICRKWLATRSTLRRHLRVHTGERPYQCVHRGCGRRFAQRAVLDRHRLVHLERRPFECSECGKGFTQRAALQSHARAHAPPHTRALHLHACTRCPKVFLSSSSLSRHIMMHKGRLYGCSACPRQFRDKSSLLRHLRSTHAQITSQTHGQTYEPPSPEPQQLSPQTQPLNGEDEQLSLDTQQHSPNTQQHSPKIMPISFKIQPSVETHQHSPVSQPDTRNVTG